MTGVQSLEIWMNWILAPLPPRLPDLDYKLRSTSSSPAHIQRLVKIGKSFVYCICVLVQC